jgi:WD40 repeat protein
LDIDAQTESRFPTAWRFTRWLCFTPDDKRLLTVSVRPGDRATNDPPWDLTAWDVANKRRIWQQRLDPVDTSLGRPYALSPDGRAFAAVLPNGRVRIVETQDGRERLTIRTTEEFATVVMFSPDSSILLTGAGFTDSTIRLWDAQSGTACGSLEGHRSWVSDLLFTPDGERLISSSGDQTIRLWDWATRKPAGVLRGHLDEVDGLAVAPDGRTLASRGKEGSIYLWDLTNPPRHLGYQVLPGRLSSRRVEFTPDSRSLLGIELDGGVALWDALTLRKTRRLWVNFTNQSGIALCPDASRVVQGDGSGRAHVWDVRSGLESTNFIAAPQRFGAWITDNGKFLLTAFGPGTNAVFDAWDTDTWQRRDSHNLHFTDFRDALTTAPKP